MCLWNVDTRSTPLLRGAQFTMMDFGVSFLLLRQIVAVALPKNDWDGALFTTKSILDGSSFPNNSEFNLLQEILRNSVVGENFSSETSVWNDAIIVSRSLGVADSSSSHFMVIFTINSTKQLAHLVPKCAILGCVVLFPPLNAFLCLLNLPIWLDNIKVNHLLALDYTGILQNLISHHLTFPILPILSIIAFISEKMLSIFVISDFLVGVLIPVVFSIKVFASIRLGSHLQSIFEID